MLGFIRITKDGNDPKGSRYRCANCGTYLADDSSLFNINGTNRHSFVNPSGIRCNFNTFINAENVVISEELYSEHTWFPSYGWRFLACGRCYAHLGWKWDAADSEMNPEGFFGLLIDAVESVPPEG